MFPKIKPAQRLTYKQTETHGRVSSTIATDALALKDQAFGI